MPPELYTSDRRQFYRERDRLRAELGMSPSAPDPLLKKRKPKAGAGR